MVANVTVIKTSDILLRFISRAVPRAVGTTAKNRNRKRNPSVALGARMIR